MLNYSYKNQYGRHNYAGAIDHYLARIEPYRASGQLQLLLPDWLPAAERLYLYYPRGRNLPAALRAFIDFFK